MSVKNTVYAIPAGSLDTTVLSGSYEQVGNPLPQACFLLKVVNGSNIGLEISYDGVTQHDYVQANSTCYIPSQANAQPQNNVALFPKGFKVWVNGDSGTGVVYVCGYFQSVAN